MELLVLWDVDYTLVSADGLGTRLYEVVFAEMFGRELTVVAPKAGRTDRAIIADTLALSGVPVSEIGPFLASLTRAAEAGGVPGAVRPLAGAAEAIAALAAAGIRQSVLTGNIRPMAALKLTRAGLRDHLDLDAGAYGDVHEVRSELVTAARRAAGQVYGADFSGAATVLVGDTPLDVEAALATGARVVAVATGSYGAAELAAAGAHVVLPDLADTTRVIAAVTGALSAVIRAGRRRGDGRRDVLINNAGVMWAPQGTMDDGLQTHFGTNHIGHCAFTGLVLGGAGRLAGVHRLSRAAGTGRACPRPGAPAAPAAGFRAAQRDGLSPLGRHGVAPRRARLRTPLPAVVA